MKVYNKKSNANRAAINQGLEASEYSLDKVDGGFVITLRQAAIAEAAPVEQAIEQAPEAEVEATEAPVAEAPVEAPVAKKEPKARKAKDLTLDETLEVAGKTFVAKAKAPKAEVSDETVALAKQAFSVAKPNSRHVAAIEAAQRGELPAKPDFSAGTHKPYRKRLAAIAAAIEAGDINVVEDYAGGIKPISTSPRALLAYATLAAIALKAKAAAAPSKTFFYAIRKNGLAQRTRAGRCRRRAIRD
jgi:hypothetical protein